MKTLKKIKKKVDKINKKIPKSLNASITIRLDNNIKEQFEDICKEMGITISSAVSIFVNRVVKDKSIPFNVSALKFPKEVNMDMMTDDEIFQKVDKSYKRDKFVLYNKKKIMEKM